MKVLLSAFACQPNRGSEPGVGWNWAISLSKYNDVYVVTRIENKKSIEEYFRHHDRSFEVIYHGNRLLEYIKRYIPFGDNLYCRFWQNTLLKIAKRLNDDIGFDICHHITYASFKYPSFLYKLKIPFVLGPVGGGEKTPESLMCTFNVKNRIIEFLREFQIEKSKKNKNIIKMFSKAAKIFVTTEDSLECIPERFRYKSDIMQTIGIEKNEILEGNKLVLKNKLGQFNILFVGEIKLLKGINLLIKIAERLKDNKTSYIFNIVGDGPDNNYFKKQVSDKNLNNMFEFKGNIPRKEVLKLYRENNLFLFPSYHDSGGMVILEAMSKNIPVLVLDTGGPSVNISDTSGFKVNKKQDVDNIVEEFISKINFVQNLYDTDEINEYINNAKQELINKHTWEVKGSLMNEEYKNILNESIIYK